MARKKPYTKGLMIVDIILTLITSGLWLFVILFRELLRHN